jgi:hypothetical protein
VDGIIFTFPALARFPKEREFNRRNNRTVFLGKIGEPSIDRTD